MKKLLTVAALTMASSMASAADFNFTGLGSVPGGGYSTTVDGITVTVTASSGSLGYFNLDGIGVKDGFFDGQAIANGQQLLVTFSEEVTIDNLHVRQWEGPDKLFLDSAGGNLTLDADTAAFNTNEWFDLTSLTGITSFTLTGSGIGTQALLAGLNQVEVTAVPLPAAAWLFGSALLGMAGLGRRKKSK